MTALLRRRRPGGRRESGAVTVEFALVVPLALLVLGFVLALGLRSLFAAATEYVARDIAREGSIRLSAPGAGTDRYPSEAMLETMAQERLGGLLSDARVDRVTDPLPPARLGEGDILIVVVTATVPGVGALNDLAQPLGLGFLTEVSQRVVVRFE